MLSVPMKYVLSFRSQTARTAVFAAMISGQAPNRDGVGVTATEYGRLFVMLSDFPQNVSEQACHFFGRLVGGAPRDIVADKKDDSAKRVR